MATKQQEREALKMIRELVDSLGEDSYIAAAFAGCFEIAEDNIENDFACSLKQLAESKEKKLDSERKKTEQLTAENAELREQIAEMESHLIPRGKLLQIRSYVIQNEEKNSRDMGAAADTIVRMADNPTDIAFANAVKAHRRAAELLTSDQYILNIVKEAVKD